MVPQMSDSAPGASGSARCTSVSASKRSFRASPPLRSLPNSSALMLTAWTRANQSVSVSAMRTISSATVVSPLS